MSNRVFMLPNEFRFGDLFSHYLLSKLHLKAQFKDFFELFYGRTEQKKTNLLKYTFKALQMRFFKKAGLGTIQYFAMQTI